MNLVGLLKLLNIVMFLFRVNGHSIFDVELITKSLEGLTEEIIAESMRDNNCLVWLKEHGAKWPVTLISSDPIPPIVAMDTTFSETALSVSFQLQCKGYIIQTPDPGYFISQWEVKRKSSLERHSPRMVILPWNETYKYTEFIFNLPQTEYISDLLLIELDEMMLSENKVSFRIITNNFYDTFDSADRIPGFLLGTWPTDKHIDYFPDKIEDLQGKTLRVATLQYPPYTILEPFEGMEHRLLALFCEIHNCSLVTVTDDNLWGEIMANDSGNGVVGNVYMDRADVGTGAVYSWYNEYTFLDFTYPYLQSRITVLVPKPQRLPEWRIPINVFTPLMWAAGLISIIIIVIILYFANKYTTKIASNTSTSLEEFSTWSGVITRTVGMALLQPPSSRLPPGSYLRIFFTLSEVFFLLFTTIYSGALSSILTVPAYYNPIESPVELYEAGIPWASDHDAWTYSILGAPEPYLSGLTKKFEAHDTETLIQLAKKGGYGFSIEIMAAGHVTHQAHLSGEMIFGLHVMKKELYRTPSVMILRKGSSYTKELTKLIHRCLDGGLLLLWEGDVSVKYLSSRLQIALELVSRSSGHELDEPVKLKINHVQGAFIVLLIGTAIACLTFIVEKFFHSFHEKRQKIIREFLH